MHDRLEPQHALAFGIALQRQQPEVDLEQRQVIRRSLDHHCEFQRGLGGTGRPLLHPEQGPQRRHVQPGPGPVRDGAEDLVHPRAGGEDQVPAVLGLVDRVGVAEPADLLVGQVQAEAQAGGVDPPVADLAQPPYSRALRQGLCDLGQAARIRDPSKAVPLLGEADPGRVRGARDILMAVEDHLGAEWRVPGHLDHQVPPGWVHDVEGVVVDVLGLLLQVPDDPAGGPLHLPHRCPRPRDQDQEHPRPDAMAGQVLLCDPVLALPGLALDDRDAVRFRPGPDPPGEPARQPHQVRVVQVRVRAAVPAAPPGPESARAMAQRVVRVQHDPEQLPVSLSEVIGHPPTVELTRTSSQDISRTAPEGGHSFRAKSRTERRGLGPGVT